MNKKELTGYPSIDNPQSINASYFEKNPIIPSVDVATLIKLLSIKNKNNNAIDCNLLKATYREMLNDSSKLAKSFKELGVKKGDIVTISLPSNYQAIISFIALNSIGTITTFVNTSLGKENLVEYLNLYSSPLLINFETSKEENEYIKKNSHVKNIITLKENLTNIKTIDIDYHSNQSDEYLNFHTLGSLSKYQKGKINLPNKGSDDALILYTSGSTGNPKSVLLTNENIIAAQIYSINTSHILNMPISKVLACVPFSYPYGLITSALNSLLWGKETILTPSLNNSTISYYYSKEPNLVFGSPAVLYTIMKNIPQYQDLSSISHFVSGGDFLYPKDIERGLEFFKSHGASNVEIGNGFGNAETVSVAAIPLGVPLKKGTAGKLLIGLNAKIVDPNTLEEKKYSEEGLLLLNGKSIFKKYYNETDETKKAKININGKEYFNTGTMGYIDADGYFTVTGRASRFYIMSSLNKVYCDAVQNVISTFEEVKSCAVVPVEDDENRYVNKCYIVLEDKVEPSNELKEYLKEKCLLPIKDSSGQFVQLKDYEVPTYIEFIDELPRIENSEKVDYKKLEEHAKEEKKKMILKKINGGINE